MSEPGGTTTQSGILYQNSITALYLGRLCDSAERPSSEIVISVRAETLDHIDDTVITYADGHREFIQAKENISKNDEAWSKLWQDFEKQLDSAEFQTEKDQFTLQIGFPQKEHSLIREICDRATTSLTPKEWVSRLSEEQIKLLDKIKLEFLPHKSNDDYVFAICKHLRVSIFSLHQIERDLLYFWIPKNNRKPLELFRLFRDRVGGEARLRGIFTAKELLKNLEVESGIVFSIQPTIAELNEIVKKCGAGLRQHKNTFGNTDIHLERQVTDDVLNWITEKTEKNVAIILDQAGTGKSVVMRDILESLDRQGAAVLAFKADQLSGINSKDGLQNKLGLSDEIERILEQFSKAKKTVLIIDQIDALSISMAHDQTTLNILLDVIAKTRFIKDLKIIISCREFDFNNDPRLAKIDIDKKFKIDNLSEEEVRAVINNTVFSFDNFSQATKELLKTPLHLDLFLLSANQSNSVSFNSLIDLNSLQDLYSLLWQNVVCKSEINAPSKSHREKVLELMTQEMNLKQKVSVPKSLITKTEDEGLIKSAEWLASHGILIPYKNEWNLIHQTFFDYCYAKNFVENGNNLYESIFSGDQGIFVRPQIIQILNYLRGVDKNIYYQELSQFLTENQIRFHLRDHVLRWFAALPNPDDNEWSFAVRLMQNAEQKQRLFIFISGNAGWFDYLKPMLIRHLENQDDSTLDNETIPLLTSFADIKQAEIAEILRPYLNRNDVWDNRIHYFFQRIHNWSERPAINLFEDYFTSTNNIERADYYELKKLAKFDKKATCRFFVRILNIIVEKIIDNFEKDTIPYIYSINSELEVLNGSTVIEILDSVAEDEAEYFLEQLIPWIEIVMPLSAKENDSRSPYFKSDSLSHYWDDGTYVVQHQLIKGLIKSLIKLAENDSQIFLKYIERLSSLNYESPQRLVSRALTKVAEKYADEAFSFLNADVRRLYLGENEVFDSRQLVKEISPFLTNEKIKVLELGIIALSAPSTFKRTVGITIQIYESDVFTAKHSKS